MEPISNLMKLQNEISTPNSEVFSHINSAPIVGVLPRNLRPHFLQQVVKLILIQPEVSLEPAVIQPQLLQHLVIFPKLLTGLENVKHPHQSPMSSPQVEQCHTKRNNLIIHRDVNLIRRHATLFIGDIFPLECLFFSGNAINLLKTTTIWPIALRLHFNLDSL